MQELQNRLIQELDGLIAYLRKYEEQTWSSTFANIQQLIDNGDRRGLDALKNMCGGMGSFTDLVICQMNGHKIEKEEEDYANKELMRLGSLVFMTADILSRELNKK